jgi:hypothetical protein
MAIAVYCFARFFPPELLEPFQATNSILAAQAGFFGSAPSFFYTLAIALFIGACASTLTHARWHCLLWIALVLLLELTQHPAIGEPLSGWLATVLPGSVWEIIQPYWTRGVFDQQDLLATLAGGVIALALLTQFSTEKNHATHE